MHPKWLGLAVGILSRPFTNFAPRALCRRMALPETHVEQAEGVEGLYFKQTSQLAEILSDIPGLSSWRQWYKAPWWLRQGDLMTVASTLREVVDLNEPEGHVIDTPDGGELTLDFYSPLREAAVVLLPGLGGSTRGGYVKNMAQALMSRGFQAVGLNMRGVGGLKSSRLASAHRGSSDDVRCAVAYLRALGSRKVFVVGWSLGGNIVVNTLAEQETREGYGHSEQSFIDGGIALCATHCLIRCARQWEEHWPMRHIYDPHVMRNLKKILEPALPFYQEPIRAWNGSMIKIQPEQLESASRIRELDEALIRRMFGYESVDDYYYQASCSRRVAKVKVPLLMVTAADDPMATGWAPFQTVRSNEYVALAYTKHGGHIAWQDEADARRSSWVEGVAGDFLQRLWDEGKPL